MRHAAVVALSLVVPFALRGQDSLTASVVKACPHAADSTDPWTRVGKRWREPAGAAPWTNDSLRRVLLAMADTDQAVRTAWIANQTDSGLERRMAVIDSTNDVRIRQIIRHDGWPTRSMVGARGESAAWLIVQHGDDSLQHAGLRLMQRAPDSEVNATELAMLDDRVRMHDHRPQRFGSQLSTRPDGKYELYTLEDPAHVDARRERAGLPPLAEYLCEIEAVYQHPVIRP